MIRRRSADEEASLRDLLARGVVTEMQLARARAQAADLEFVELIDYPVDRQAVTLVPAAVCRRHSVLPIGIRDGILLLAMADPGDVFAIDDVRAGLKHGRRPDRRREGTTCSPPSTATCAPTTS